MMNIRFAFRLAVCVVLLAFLTATSRFARAQPGAPRRPHVPVLSAEIADSQVVFSWNITPATWGLFVQTNVLASDWKQVPAGQYQTNGAVIKVSLPLSPEPKFYVLRRYFNGNAVTPPGFPMPSTNLPSRVRRPNPATNAPPVPGK